MKRIKLLVGGVATIAVLTMTGGVASAQSLPYNSDTLTLSQLIKTPIFAQTVELPKETLPLQKVVETKPEVIPEPPKPVEYTVVSGDNLTKIAEAQKTTWERLYQKNTLIINPNLIDVGQVLIIPFPDEVLAERPLPVFVLPPSVAHTSYTVAGNGYDYGFCTWYVKNRRPDLPNNLGNANTWYYMAQNYGIPTGTTPLAGAVGTTTSGGLGHVVYVESVNTDGSINISEMNYAGFGVQSSRVASASSFLYIY